MRTKEGQNPPPPGKRVGIGLTTLPKHRRGRAEIFFDLSISTLSLELSFPMGGPEGQENFSTSQYYGGSTFSLEPSFPLAPKWLPFDTLWRPDFFLAVMYLFIGCFCELFVSVSDGIFRYIC